MLGGARSQQQHAISRPQLFYPHAVHDYVATLISNVSGRRAVIKIPWLVTRSHSSDARLCHAALPANSDPAAPSPQIMKAGSQRVTYNEAALRNGLNVVSTLRSRNPGLVQLPDTSVHDRQLDTIMKDVQQREAGAWTSVALPCRAFSQCMSSGTAQLRHRSHPSQANRASVAFAAG